MAGGDAGSHPLGCGLGLVASPALPPHTRRWSTYARVSGAVNTSIRASSCSFLASLDGYVADDAGGFEWAVPDEEVLEFINGLERGVGTYLYGRTIYR